MRMHVSKVQNSQKMRMHNLRAFVQFAKLVTCSPVLSPKCRFYSQMAIMATGWGITECESISHVLWDCLVYNTLRNDFLCKLQELQI